MSRKGKMAIAVTGGAVVLCGLVVCWWFDILHDAVEKIPRLHGKELSVVIAEFGKPDQTHEINLADPLPEFRVELYNVFPPDDPMTASVTIRELQWHYTTYNVAVWLHCVNGKWIVVDTCRWKEGVVF